MSASQSPPKLRACGSHVAGIAIAVVAAGLAAIGLSRAGRAQLAGAHRNMERSSMPDPRAYDVASRWLLGPVYERICRSIIVEAPAGAAVLDIGCGPGHLGIRLARRAGRGTAEPGLRVVCADLDPAMIARAEANAELAFAAGDPGRPEFTVADVAALPFPDRSFDIVVSSFSLHHWSDPATGLTEVHRVLRPGGTALIWDIAGLPRRLEVGAPGPAQAGVDGPFGQVRVGERWGLGPLTLVERYDLVRPGDGAIA